MIVIVCSAVIRKGNAFLMVKEFKPAAAGKWGLPGGKLDEGEGIDDTVVREVHEETGLTVTGHKLFRIINKPKTHEGNTVVRFIFLCDVDQQPADSAEHEYAYIEIDELQQLEKNGLIRGKEVLPLLKTALDGPGPNMNDLIQTQL